MTSLRTCYLFVGENEKDQFRKQEGKQVGGTKCIYKCERNLLRLGSV